MFTHDATYYAHRIKKGQESVTDLIETSLLLIEQLNPILNAVTAVYAEQALDKAKQHDEYLQRLSVQDREELPAFFGVPILLKDLGQNLAGEVSTSGSKLLINEPSEKNDHFVQALIDAGFIIIGRTNVPEFGFKNISDSALFGEVNHPLDLSRNPGGSSGGAAAALKSGIVPIVTASDGGGSIRIPASFTGLIGLKPSRGRVVVGPGSYRNWQGASVHFALTKSVRDTWHLLKSLQSEQREAPFHLPVITETELKPLTKKLRIAYSALTPDLSPLDPQAEGVLEQAIAFLSAMGHELVEDRPVFDGVKTMKNYYKMNSVETAAMMQDIEKLIQSKVTSEDMEVMSWAIYQAGLKISGVTYSDVLADWDQLTALLEAFFKDYDLWLTPSTNGIAPEQQQFTLDADLTDQLVSIDQLDVNQQQDLIYQMFEKSLALTPYTQVQNLSGHPAISLPIRTVKDTLPLGIQFTAGMGQEYLLLQLARQLEEANYLGSDVSHL